MESFNFERKEGLEGFESRELMFWEIIWNGIMGHEWGYLWEFWEISILELRVLRENSKKIK